MTSKLICALCPAELTQYNKTKEHIIPNSLGGWEKIEGFICLSCNSKKGDTWDAELALQFNWLSIMVGIVRDRNKPPPELVSTASGEKFLLKHDGSMLPAKFTYEEIKDGEQTKISFVARTSEEARKKIEEIAKRFPQIEKEQLLSNAKVTTSYLDEPLHVPINFGGPLAGRSVVNTALAFAFWKGITPHSCENVLEFLRNETTPSSCYGLCYLKDIVKNRPVDTNFHCVGIYGDKTNRRLLAYVEYFGLARWLIVLSNEYDGPELQEVYSIDPTSANTIDIELSWSLSDEMIVQTISGYGYTDESYADAIHKAMEKIMRRSDERNLNHAIETSFLKAGEKLGLKIGDQITPEHSRPFSLAMAEELAPYILRRMGMKSWGE